jgi:serine/threonine protein kinase
LENGNIFAVKKIPISSEKDKYFIKSLKLELKILKELKHPNIVEYFGSETINEIFYIYLEYMNAGDISKILK